MCDPTIALCRGYMSNTGKHGDNAISSIKSLDSFNHGQSRRWNVQLQQGEGQGNGDIHVNSLHTCTNREKV